MATSGHPAKPKSILKKKSPGTAATSTGKAPSSTHGASAQDSLQDRNFSLALQRANLLQAQKDVESLILASIESLLELPTSSSATAAEPTPADVVTFQTALDPFRTLDFDDLIEERYAAGLCGYVLCARKPRKSEQGRGKWKIGGAAGAGEVIDRRKFETWCSDACARRAMYVRVQLDDTPAWLRDDYHPPPVTLVPEETEEKATMGGATFALPIRSKQLDGVQKEALASERGETVTSGRSVGLLKDNIVERKVFKPAVAPVRDNDQCHELVEGYEVGSKPTEELLEDLLHFG